MTAWTRKLARSAAAATLVLPLSVSAVAVASPTAEAAVRDHGVLVDDWFPPFPGGGSGSSDSVDPFSGFGGFGAVPGYGSESPGTASSYSSLDTSDASEEQSAGVVQISTVIDYGNGGGAGTGLVLGEDGLVVTNHHVVEGATEVTVTVPTTGDTYDAEVLGYDATTDVALLQLEDADGLDTVTTDSAGVAAGDDVTAVGDAGGDGGNLTAAPGTVSDPATSITVQDELAGGESRLRGLIEITSDVVAGDSGGAVLDADGEVVGMTVAASSGNTTETVDGYAIPIARVLAVVEQIESGVETDAVSIGSSAFLGVELDGASGSTTIAGVVDDSPAAELGLAAGDTVTAIDGTTVATGDELSTAIAAHDAGDTIEVRWRDAEGTAHDADVVLDAGPVG